MPKYLLFTLVFAFMLIAHQIDAQFIFMNGRIEIPYYFKRHIAPSFKYDFQVAGKNIRTPTLVRGKISFDKKVNKYYLKGKDTVVYPEQTLFIYRIDNDSNFIEGTPNEGKWLFPIINGEINCYSHLADFSYYHISYVQKQDGEIYPYNKDFFKHRLGTWVEDDKESYRYYKKMRRNKSIKTLGPPLAFVASLTTAILAPSGSALQVGSWFGVLVLPITIHTSFKRIPTIKVIEKYNSR